MSGAPMTAHGLRRWAALDDRRRQRARTGLAALPRWVHTLAAGGAIAVFSAPDPSGVRLLGVATVACAIVLCAAPFRQFWRRDSALLAQLPLTGAALYGLAIARARALTGHVLGALLPAIVALALAAPATWPRHAAIVLALAALAALAGPAIALGAGAVVASDRARAALASLGGEMSAPPTVWLGALPAFAASAQILFAIDLAPWAAGGSPVVGDPAVLVGLAIGGSLVAAGWARAAADRVMPGALREVAALDRERLAHVDRSRPSPLERAARGLLPAAAARVFDKDARLTRRRHPSPYALGPLAVVVSWLLLLGDGTLGWSVGLIGALGAYAALMAVRAVAPPIEDPRMTATLPIAPADVARAKLGAAALRTLTWTGLAGLPLALRRPEPLVVVVVALAALAPLVVAARTGRAA